MASVRILFAAAACSLLTPACTMVERQEAKSTEQLLSAAGFAIRPADTPEKLASLQAMKQRTLLRSTAADGGLRFAYADAALCRCIYVGDEAAYQRYQKFAVQKQIADAERQAAIDETLDSPWGYPWWGDPY